MAGRPASSDRLVRQAQNIIDRASKSFATASRLFPVATRRDVVLLYTWCRHCDDLTDGQRLGRGTIRTASSDTLARLRADSLAALAGQPTSELPFQALADLSRRHTISRALVEAHIRGFELDVEGWQPKTLDDTMKYCYHTAGTVGMMMASIMNVEDALTLQRASDLGIAFQLTNIARDVGEDAMAGRSYLPEEWRVAAGLEIADLAHADRATQVFPLVKRLAEEAEPYYDSAAIGIRALPRRAAWAIATARAVYRDIGHQIMRRGPDALSERVFTSKARKTWLMISAGPDALAPRHLPAATDSRAGLWTPPKIA
ncbi:MAG: phytoene/squalene synthase family protein [Wenzhouxiangella sp.]|jgi:phytoene synthase|nr:phytoene/squalene synthase family protein [Wenzhouxiangella sp.]